MNVYQKLCAYIKDSGRSFAWVARKAVELGCPTQLDSGKLGKVANGNRNLTADEFLYICMALEVNPDIFMRQMWSA